MSCRDPTMNTPSPPRGLDTSHAMHDKQTRIESDVRASAVLGHMVWLGHADGSITIRKVRTTEVVATIPPSNNRGRPWCLLPVAVQGFKPAMWVGYSSGDIEVLDAESRQQLKLVCRHTGGVYCLAEFNGFVYSGSNDFEIVQWCAKDVSFVRQFTGHTNYVRVLHAEGGILISGSDDHTVRIWNSTNGQLISTGRFHRSGVSAMCRVGDDMWTGDDTGIISVWRLRTLEQQETLHEHGGRINTLAKIGSRVYSASADHTVGVWDALDRSIVARIDQHRGWVTHLFAPAQLTRFYVWTASADSTIRCWHHDEYRSCTRDVLRFADLQWFQNEYNPYRELNDELENQVLRLQTQCNNLMEAYSIDHSHIENCTAQVEFMRKQVDAAEAEAESCRLQVKEAQQRITHLVEINSKKEAELHQLSDATKAVRNESIDLRCQSERLKAENEELRRQMELCSCERDKLKRVLNETLELRVEKGEAVPVIVTTAGEAADALIHVQRELQESVKLNETLREDLNRVTRVLAAATTSNVAMGAADRRAHSPRLTNLFQPRRQANSSYGLDAQPPPPSSARYGAASIRYAAERPGHRQLARSYVMDRYFAAK